MYLVLTGTKQGSRMSQSSHYECLTMEINGNIAHFRFLDLILLWELTEVRQLSSRSVEVGSGIKDTLDVSCKARGLVPISSS
ncbi:hypothetical protein CEP52_008499 [Fusarium oligoseptatum]|uniref:Uncharacterized protein n=1 Tax=Fusarium oligoseptatum TaxID=2604345 RepID=A0A428THM3_9HYPO|nr:hypothetical protein CEP52_008499 [Fusarium oligoseptatum]